MPLKQKQRKRKYNKDLQIRVCERAELRVVAKPNGKRRNRFNADKHCAGNFRKQAIQITFSI